LFLAIGKLTQGSSRI